MNRNLKYERVFPLGEYKTLRLTDEINDLPSSMVMNPEVIDKIRLMQMVQVELTHKRYLAMGTKMSKYTNLEDMMEYLEELRETTLQDLIKLFKNGKLEEQEITQNE